MGLCVVSRWGRRCVIAAALALGIALGAPAGAWAQTTVCASGCDYNSIDAASDGEAAGETITVLQGVYNEDVTIQSGKDGQTFNGPFAGTPGNDSSRGSNEAIVNGGFGIGSNNITINGFTIQNNDLAGVDSSGSISGYQILNNIIQNNQFGILSNSNGTNASSILENLIAGNNGSGGQTGILGKDAATQNVTIGSNEINNHNLAAIDIGSTGNADITVQNNEADGTFGFANGTDNINVTGNTINGANGGGIEFQDVSESDINTNTIDNSSSDGVDVIGGSDIEIADNDITDTGNGGASGIELDDVDDVTNEGNTVTGASNGVQIKGGVDNVTVSGDTLKDNGVGVLVRDDGAGPNSGVDITGNTILNNGDGLVVDDAAHTGSVEVHFNRIAGNDGGNTGVVNNDTNDQVDAENNWWGCNEGPGVSDTGCDQVDGDVSFDPWLVLSIEADSDTIVKKTGTTGVTASLLTNSDGNDPAGADQFPDGTTITFEAAKKCTLSGPSSDTTQNGEAESEVKAKNDTGKCKAKAFLDSEKAKTIIQVVKP